MPSAQVIVLMAARNGIDAFLALLDRLMRALPADEPHEEILNNVGYHNSHALRYTRQQATDRLQPFFLIRSY